MKILVVSQYFWPEYFRVNDLVEEFKNKDLDVEILTSNPNYPEGKVFTEFKQNKKKFSEFKSCKIYRVPQISRGSGSLTMLTLNYFSFIMSSLIFSFIFIRKKKYDYVFTFATSPILVALTSIVVSKMNNSKHILWVLDLWPNVLHDLNIFNKKSLTYRLSKKIVKFIYKNSDIILCQSLTYKKKINLIDKSFTKKTIYFPSWPEESKKIKFKELIKKDQNIFSKNKINIIFTGNIGDAQNFGLVLELIKVTTDKINWIIAGKGRRYQFLQEEKKKYKLENLKLLGLLKFDDLIEYVRLSDVLLISLKSGDTFDATIPGKFQTYLSYKKRIIGLIGGEVNSIINKYNIGFATNEKDILKIKSQILSYLSKNHNENEFNKNIEILKKIYSKKRNIQRLISLFNKLNPKMVIKYATNTNQIPFDKNFIFSAFNLAFCGAFNKKEILLHKDLYVWPDGFYFNKVSKLKEKKLPGRLLLNDLFLPNNIEEIIVIGNLNIIGKKYLEEKFNRKVSNVLLPYGNLSDFKSLVPNLKENQLCILTLPTPKQEILANYIKSTQPNFKILCLGAAINMASGEEKPLPKYLEKIFIAETIWRLQFETTRRVKRLLSSFFSYISGKRKGIYEKLIFEKINE